MRTIPLGLICLLLAACAPAIVPQGTNGDVLPVEAQRVIDRATATAGAVATQAAQATATGQSARETATAARLGTLEALTSLQTESALQITQAAVRQEYTASAERFTQAARDTATWATPTAAAMRAGATAQAAENAARRAQAGDVAEFWRTLRLIVLALLIVGGLSAICVVVIDAITRIRIARMGQAAIIAREAFRVLAPGHWAEWQPGEGYQVYPLPGLLETSNSALPVIENTPTAPDRAHAWRQAVRLFCWWGDRYGFGVRELGPAGAGVVSDPAWRVLAKLLKAAGVLAETAQPGKRGKTTGWAPEWDYRRLHDDLGHGRLALPFPTDGPAPEVRYTVPNTTPQAALHTTATQESR